MSDLAARLDSFLARLEHMAAAATRATRTGRRRKRSAGASVRACSATSADLQASQAASADPSGRSQEHRAPEKDAIVANTRQFVQKLPANNVLLTGARGTGKSSLIKACLNAYVKEGLRLVEVDKDDLGDLADIVELLAQRPERFVIFCDDLSFEDGECGLQVAEVRAGRLGGRPVGQRADLRHVQPSPPAARVHEGQRDLPAQRPMARSIRARWSRRRSRCPSALVCGCRFTRPSRTSTWPSSAIGWGTSAAAPRTLPPRVAMRWSGRWSAVRARAGWRGSSRATGAASTASRSVADVEPQADEQRWHGGLRGRPGASGHRGGRRRAGAAQMAASCWRSARRASRTRATGNSRAASSSRARPSRPRCARELHEELGLDVTRSERCARSNADYPHAYVRLYFCKVTDWVGQPVGREGQAFSWQYAPVDVGPLLPATIPVVAWLAEERPTPEWPHAGPVAPVTRS